MFSRQYVRLRRDLGFVHDDVEPAQAKRLSGSRGQVPMLGFGSVMFGGLGRIETCPNARRILQQASFCQLDRAIGEVGHGRVYGLVHVAAWGSRHPWRRRQQIILMMFP